MISIVVNLQVEGVHCWPACDIADVSYLAHPHRHVFAIRCEKEVKKDNREIEIICFKRLVLDYLSAHYGTPADFGEMSCEMIAGELVRRFSLSLCEVLEDGENGAKIVTNI